MKFAQVFIKVRQNLPKWMRLLGQFAGLVAVPLFWNLIAGGYPIYCLICLIFLVLYYHSFMRLKATYNDDIYVRFLEELQEDSTKKEYLIFLFKQKNFWLQFAVTATLFCLIPFQVSAPVIDWIFATCESFKQTLVVLLFFIPFLLISYIVAHISAIDYWQQSRGMKRDVSKKIKRSTYISLMAAYAFVPIAVLMILSVFTQYGPLVLTLWQRHPSPLFLVIVVVSILFVISSHFFRVLFARKKCIREIKKVCHQKNIEVTDIKHPYLSAFYVCKDESFQISVRGKTYSCKLVGAPKRMVPLVIHPLGGLHFMYSFNLFKTPIFTHTKVREFGYESEFSKILIINPVPKKLFCHFGNKIEEIDNGALVGGYKIYTATAFVRAIDNDILDR